MDKKQVLERIKQGRLWFTKNEEGRTVWGVGDDVLPIEVEFTANNSVNKKD